jgi:hypothetical protein
MSINKEEPGEGLKYGLGADRKPAETKDFLHPSLGQLNPQHYPRPNQPSQATSGADGLGEPMNIAEVAGLLGCSMWTVRQKYLPQGLPHVRASAVGKIVFFREQVINWILKRQQKKGGNRL